MKSPFSFIRALFRPVSNKKHENANPNTKRNAALCLLLLAGIATLVAGLVLHRDQIDQEMGGTVLTQDPQVRFSNQRLNDSASSARTKESIKLQSGAHPNILLPRQSNSAIPKILTPERWEYARLDGR